MKKKSEWINRSEASKEALGRQIKESKTTLRQQVARSALFYCHACGRLAAGNHVAAEFGDGTYSAGGWMHFCNSKCVATWEKALAKFDVAKP